jgi:hypothetical protein
MKQQLHSCLAKEGISSYSTTMAIHGTNPQTGTPKLILLTDEFLSPQQRQNIPSSIKYVNLRLRSHPASQETLREQYKETADPGTIIGAADRPNTSFSNGWWVRDCQTGSIFNLTAAHPLKAAAESTPFSWSVRNESSRSQTVDCPPFCAINAICLQLRHELNDLQGKDGREMEIEQNLRDLADLQRDLNRRDYATVVAAGYGEYSKIDESGEKVCRVEDWSLLRPRSNRIGKNVFPPTFAGNRYFSVGEIRMGIKCFLSGATSGVNEGYVWDELETRLSDHDVPMRNWIVRHKHMGIFGQDGDSGAPIGLEGGLAGGTYVSGGTGEYANEEKSIPIYFSIITSLKDTFERIRVATGRELELPSEYDLSRRQDRDRYHREKTGLYRERH